MNLDQYKIQIQEILSSDLTDRGKASALHLMIRDIDSACWNPWAVDEANSIASEARLHEARLGGNTLEGLEELAKCGLLVDR